VQDVEGLMPYGITPQYLAEQAILFIKKNPESASPSFTFGCMPFEQIPLRTMFNPSSLAARLVL
jgi:hypothetical protein